jgi:hypothetical protein
MAKIFNSPENEWQPVYEGLDFTEHWIGAIATASEGFVYFDTYENYTFQLTEENTVMYMNDARDEMDGIAIIDPRDDNAWWWFRGIYKEFDYLESLLCNHATIITTVIPRAEVVKNYMALMKKDLSDFVPEEWGG